MSLPPYSGHHASSAGLCSRCEHAQEVKNARGSMFLLCGLSATDPRFPRYPRLPVHACTGFLPAPGEKERAT
ncbi:MAG TPA: hypothetical protein VMF59_05150 [Bacteroidota bacterium]|nr:hypothetical protein [Bacteroidota bacterium]